jgi:tetratricopeptide (TPR) repeat protein
VLKRARSSLLLSSIITLSVAAGPPAWAEQAKGESPPAAPAPAPAPAPDAAKPAGDDKTAQAKAEFQKGQEFFKAGQFVDAVKSFKKAYAFKPLPALLYNIGITYRKMNENELSIFYFDKFLKESPADAANRADAQKQLEELRAQKGGPGMLPGSDKESEPVAAAPPSEWKTVDKFDHQPPDEAPPGKPLDIRAMVPEKVAYKLTLYWRSAGQADFTAVEMHKRYYEFVGRIPATAVTGKSVQYYMIVKDPTGKTYAKSGSPTQPNLIIITEGAKPLFYADLGEGMGGSETKAAEKTPEKGPAAEKEKKGQDSESPLTAEKAPPPKKDEGPKSRSRWMAYTAYGLAGGAALSFIIAYTSNNSAKDAADALQTASTMKNADGSPKTFYNSSLSDKESEGRSSASTATLMTTLGALLTVGAGTLLYLDLRQPAGGTGDTASAPRRTSAVSSVRAAPTLLPGYYGLSGEVRF